MKEEAKMAYLEPCGGSVRATCTIEGWSDRVRREVDYIREVARDVRAFRDRLIGVQPAAPAPKMDPCAAPVPSAVLDLMGYALNDLEEARESLVAAWSNIGDINLA
jgi:hypothetical protein